MTLKEKLLTAAETLLTQQPDGLTSEALAKQIAKKLGQPLPPPQIIAQLRATPQRFIESSGGRWQLRQQKNILLDEPLPTSTPSPTAKETSPRPLALKRDSYVVFDLEATHQDALSPYTEIIQIAAQRWDNGHPQQPWMSFAHPSVPIPERIIQLTKIKQEELEDAPSITEALQAFFTYIGDLPLIAHNGASYDGPLIKETCKRQGIPLPPTFLVLDTLPLARTLLPTLETHRVGTLAEHFGCARADAHRADADVEMLAGVIQGMAKLIHHEPSGHAVYTLLARANDPWAALLPPPTYEIELPKILLTLGAQIKPLLPDHAPAQDLASAVAGTIDSDAVEAAFAQAESLGRRRREPQVMMSKLAADTFRTGGYAIIEAGTGVGKSQGYLLPAALYARATRRPVAVATFTRVLQTQLIRRELPFIQQLVPEITYAQLQGRSNYLSLSRLAEEIEDALTEETLPVARAWMLATLLRFAATSADGNLEELGVVPQALDTFLQADGAVLQVLASMRASQDDYPTAAVPLDFYRRARENAERADLIVINHALLLNNSLGIEIEELPFAGTIVCDEAHTLEDAATLALEQRVDERVLRRILRAIYNEQTRSGLVIDARRRLQIPADQPTLKQVVDAVDRTQATLDSLSARLNTYARGQTVVAQSDLERYGVRVSIDGRAFGASGGPALKSAVEAFTLALHELRIALGSFLETIGTVDTEALPDAGVRRKRRIIRLGRSLLRDLRKLLDNYEKFWSFGKSANFVRIIELSKIIENNPPRRGSALNLPTLGLPTQLPNASVTMLAVPINVGPLMWEQLWSRLDAAICTSATLTVHGQGFDFFLSRIGLEAERVQTNIQGKALTTCALPHAFDYHSKALFMMPNNLPAPRDTELKRNFPAAVADLLERFIPFFEGKTLGLFTANARRDFVFQALVDKLAELGFPLYSQGQGSLLRLIDEFRLDEKSSLLGSRSLWEGVDVPGPSLSYVFMEKLPYPSLGDPVEAARMSAVENAGGNAFYGYLLPKMVIILKQGFGRLIRSTDDNGAVILLDKRLRNSLYRTEVLGSLPNPTLGYESDVDMFQRIAAWMGLDFDPADLPAPTVSDIQRVLHEQQLSTAFVSAEDFELIAKPRLLAVQKAIWNQDTFRDGQEEIMRDVLAGKDVLTLLPTGAGKSRTYQLPALIRPGLTLVISPLIALIRDQVEKLREVPGLTCVAALVSGMDSVSQEDVLLDALQDRLKLLYISPERLRDPRFRTYLQRILNAHALTQIVVDEAHCISTWGHDFRPDFLGIAQLLPQNTTGDSLPVHALTATATRQVQQEIIATLHMGERELSIRTGDFVRANLIFRFYTVERGEERDQLAVSIVHQLVHNEVQGGSGIVYVATRKTAVQLARLLRDHNVAAQAYHGGMQTAERHLVQERFMQGELDVVVATSAFGMGVDKSSIRFVLHYDHPASLEAYIQEAGRAGRDGLTAYAILLYHQQSQKTERFIARQGVPDMQVLRRYRNALLSLNEDDNQDDETRTVIRLADNSIVFDPDTLADLARVETTQARILLYSFEESGLVQRKADCTIEAALSLDRPIEQAISVLDNEQEREVAQALLTALQAEPNRTVTYRASEVYPTAGIDPRLIDSLLVKLSERQVLLYRAYSRGINLHLNPLLKNSQQLMTISQGFATRYQRFEERLQAMLDYIRLKRGQNNCRSADLINYLTGRDDTPFCGKCDLCSPEDNNLPWKPDHRLYGEKLTIDVRLSILGAVRDHNAIFGRVTIEQMLRGREKFGHGPQSKPLSTAARSSDHFAELADRSISNDQVRHTFDALIEGGFLQYIEKQWRNDTTRPSYQAIAITQKGRDALAGGVPLPNQEKEEKQS